jgi:hypothetical protein
METEMENSKARIKTLSDDLEALEELIASYYSELLPTVKACLSVICAMAFEGRTKALSLMLETTSGYGKSAVVQMFFPLNEQGGLNDYVYRSDKFTPKSFVSHATNVSREKLAGVDLLPQLRNKVLITKELAPLFRGREDELTETFSILIPVLDGKGFTSNSGAQGRRGYQADILFNWIGATTPFPRRTYQLMYQLGTRLLFYEVPAVAPDEAQLTEYTLRDDTGLGEIECRKAVNDILIRFFSDFPVGKVPTEAVEIGAELAHQIAQWALFLTYCRRSIETERIGNDYTPISAGTPEGPFKILDYLKMIARGHALLHERSEVADEEIKLVEHVAISSIPRHLRPIVRKLQKDGRITSTECAKLCSVTQPTARRYLLEASLLACSDLAT